MQELLIKDAPLIIPYGKKKYLFIIKQASLSEILEFDFYLQKDKEIVKHILSLLKKLNPDFTNNVFNKISPEGFSQIHNFFLKNYCTGFYELKKDKKQAEIKKSSVDIEKVPFSSIIAGIITNSNETMASLLKLSWEQIEYMTDGLIWNGNELTAEGKAKNRKKITKDAIKSGSYDDTLENLRKNREKLNKKFNIK